MRERIAIIGASGGIGRALVALAATRGAEVIPISRPASDPADEAGFQRAAEAAGEGLTHVIVASGLLHREGRGPERDLRHIDPAWLMESFRVNSLIPALAAKHYVPRLCRDRRAVFAVLTARVGSIADNRLGGWHSYRMSKAAANQLARTVAIELRRKAPLAVAVALHPGTVDTGMSKPFQRNLAEGQLKGPAEAAGALWHVIDRLKPEDSGRFLAWDGTEIPW